MDILAVDTEWDLGWQFPSRETMMSLQANRGLARTTLRVCKVKEIILNGDQTEDEQRRIINWHHQQLAMDQEHMPGAPLSLDVEEIHCTLMDVLHLTGQRPHQETEYVSTTHLDESTTDSTRISTCSSPAG